MVKNRYHYFLILLIVIMVNLNCQSETSNELEISLIPIKNDFYFGEPIGCTLSIKNLTDDYLVCFACEDNQPIKSSYDMCGKSEGYEHYYYPRFLSGGGLLNFNEKDLPQGITKREIGIPVYISNLKTQKVIAPNQIYTRTIYINSYLHFNEVGDFEIGYMLNTPILDKNGSTKKIVKDGQLRVRLQKVPDWVLDQSLDYFFNEILTSKQLLEKINDKDKMRYQEKIYESIEALCFLDTPNAIKYLEKLLDINGVEVHAIKALARFQKIEADRLLESALIKFKEKNAAIVHLILNEIIARKTNVQDNVIKELLESRNDGTRCAVIKYISRTGNSMYISMLEPFLKDTNLEISKATQDGINEIKKFENNKQSNNYYFP